MAHAPETTETWLALGEAARQLDVHPSTLRRWADSGAIPVLLTPGGHRRFAASDLKRFTRGLTGGPTASRLVDRDRLGDALRATRRELRRQPESEWLSRFDDGAREQNRALGRRLMALTMRHAAGGGDRDRLLDEARSIGKRYGAACSDLGLSHTDAIEAVIFFRDALVEAALEQGSGGEAAVPPREHMRVLRRINDVLDAVQLSIAGVYDGA